MLSISKYLLVPAAIVFGAAAANAAPGNAPPAPTAALTSEHDDSGIVQVRREGKKGWRRGHHDGRHWRGRHGYRAYSYRSYGYYAPYGYYAYPGYYYYPPPYYGPTFSFGLHF